MSKIHVPTAIKPITRGLFTVANRSPLRQADWKVWIIIPTTTHIQNIGLANNPSSMLGNSKKPKLIEGNHPQPVQSFSYQGNNGLPWKIICQYESDESTTRNRKTHLPKKLEPAAPGVRNCWNTTETMCNGKVTTLNVQVTIVSIRSGDFPLPLRVGAVGVVESSWLRDL